MRELAIAGCIAAGFGLGSFYATDHFGAFSSVNLCLGAAALCVALVLGARRLRVVSHPHARRALLRGFGGVALASVAAVGLERAATRADLRFDWTFEGRYRLAPATREALEELCGPIELVLFYDARDPRVRRTRLLVDTLARHGDVSVRQLELNEAPAEVDRYGIGGSNSLVIRRRGASGPGERYELAERPNEGPIFEALYRLCSPRGGVIATLRGEGEGDVERQDPVGYAGLAAALATEGYEVRSLVTAAQSDVPEDVGAVLAIAPQREIQPSSLAALERFLERGGALIALLEPDVASGLEPLLARWGLETPAALVRDPAPDAKGAEATGVGIIATHYESHPITAGLDASRMTYFPGARAFQLHKPQARDRLSSVVLSSPRAWLSDARSPGAGLATPKDDTPRTYQPIAVAGRYPRAGHVTRIFAVGDAGFASNQHLRTLYNLDLVMNGVHWALAREPAITLRPKIRDTVQLPLPVTDSLRTLYGVGLLVPELLLVAGSLVWLRRRAG